MNELPQDHLDPLVHSERTESGNSPMTTLTLSAELKETEQGLESLAPSVRPSPIPVEQLIERPIEEVDDHALIAATREGDKTAFDEVVRRYRDKIINYVYRMIDDYERAVDLTQETFVRVYLSAERYQATYNFSTYIYRIAHNLAISELRQRKRRRLIPLPTFFSDKDSEEVEVEIEDKRQVLTEDAMIAEERRAAVAKAIASLPEIYRAPLVLCDLEEKSYEEISAVLELPVGTVKSRINRARNLLKDKLRDLL